LATQQIKHLKETKINKLSALKKRNDKFKQIDYLIEPGFFRYFSIFIFAFFFYFYFLIENYLQFIDF